MKITILNKNRIKEYLKVLGNNIEIEYGFDNKYRTGNYHKDIMIKALNVPRDTIVEDTVILTKDKHYYDFKEDMPLNKEKAFWITSIAYNRGKEIYFYQGIIEGKIEKTTSTDFDKVFIPRNYDMPLIEVEKDKYFKSARILALENMLKNNHYKVLQA